MCACINIIKYLYVIRIYMCVWLCVTCKRVKNFLHVLLVTHHGFQPPCRFASLAGHFPNEKFFARPTQVSHQPDSTCRAICWYLLTLRIFQDLWSLKRPQYSNKSPSLHLLHGSDIGLDTIFGSLLPGQRTVAPCGTAHLLKRLSECFSCFLSSKFLAYLLTVCGWMGVLFHEFPPFHFESEKSFFPCVVKVTEDKSN